MQGGEKIILGCAVAIGALLLSAPTFAQEDVAAVAARMKAFPLARGVEAVEAYTPAETVQGRPQAIPTARRGDPGVTREALAAADAYAESQGSYALIVARGGRIVHERYWQGFGPESRFSTASMHKSVMALSYGPAVAAGRIELDTGVGRYLREWANDPRGKITVRQLLQMASGLASPPGGPDPASPGAQLMFGEDIARVALGFTPAQPPGTEFAYANVNSQLAGLALERAVGGRYADWLSRTLWRPIGASDAALWLDRPGGTPHYFCCLQARPRDWLRVGELIRNKGRAGGRQVLSAAWIDTVTAPSALNPNYGLQVWRGTPHHAVRRYSRHTPMTVAAAEPFARDDVVFLDGAGGQRVYVVPSAGLTVVRIGRPALQWDDSRLPNILLGGLQ